MPLIGQLRSTVIAFLLILDVNCYTDFTRLEESLGTNCDQNLLSLLKCMLHENKRERSSVEELLNHVFIRQGAQHFMTQKQLHELKDQVNTLQRSESQLMENKKVVSK